MKNRYELYENDIKLLLMNDSDFLLIEKDNRDYLTKKIRTVK